MLNSVRSRFLVVFAISLLPLCLGFSKKQPKPEEPVAAAPSAAPQIEMVWVGKSDETKSCGTDKGIPIDTMANQLQANSIKIFSKKKIHDGMMRIQMCGTDKGSMNGFQIAKTDLDKALGLGFKAVTSKE